MVTVLYFTPSVEDDNEEAALALEELKNELVECIDKLTKKYPSIQRESAPFGSLARSRRYAKKPMSSGLVIRVLDSLNVNRGLAKKSPSQPCSKMIIESHITFHQNIVAQIFNSFAPTRNKLNSLKRRRNWDDTNRAQIPY